VTFPTTQNEDTMKRLEIYNGKFAVGTLIEMLPHQRLAEPLPGTKIHLFTDAVVAAVATLNALAWALEDSRKAWKARAGL